MRKLNEAVAFITGGAQGIGLAIAHSLARRGATIALADIDPAALEVAGDELSRITRVETFRLDVRDRTHFAEVADLAESRLGSVTVVCNNAGIAFPESVTTMNYRLWDLAMDINLGGVINGVQTFLPRMIERGAAGHIVNTASAAGLVSAVGYMYTAAKFAVVGLSESLRAQLEAAGLPIGVTVLCPGGVATNLARSTNAVFQGEATDADFEAAQARVEQQVPNVESLLHRYGVAPEEVGELTAAAIAANQLYALTDRAGAALVAARAEAITAAMPADEPRGSIADLKRAGRQAER